MKSKGGARVLIAGSLALALAGCCDKAVLDRCRAEAAQRQALVAQPAIDAAAGPMRFKVRAASDATIAVELVHAECRDGKGGGAQVKVAWDVARAGLAGVRVRVGANGNADKVWIESGPKSEGVTGPWINDGSLIRISDSFDDSVVAEIKVHGLACNAGDAK